MLVVSSKTIARSSLWSEALPEKEKSSTDTTVLFSLMMRLSFSKLPIIAHPLSTSSIILTFGNADASNSRILTVSSSKIELLSGMPKTITPISFSFVKEDSAITNWPKAKRILSLFSHATARLGSNRTDSLSASK